jgi:hypothetical protein
MQRKTIQEMRRVFEAAIAALDGCETALTAKQIIDEARRMKKIVAEELDKLEIKYTLYSLSGVVKRRGADDKGVPIIKSTLETLITVAVALDKKGYVARGMSIRIPRDPYCKVVGQAQALRRLLRAIRDEKGHTFTITTEGFDAFTLVSDKSDEGLSLIRGLYFMNDKRKHKAWLVHHGGGPFMFEKRLMGIAEPLKPAEPKVETETKTETAPAAEVDDSLEAWQKRFKDAEGKGGPTKLTPAVMGKPMTSSSCTTYPRPCTYHGDFEGYHD